MNSAPRALSLFYRGSLKSCSYRCGYCPFAKRRDSAQQTAQDTQELANFVAWVGAQNTSTSPPLRILFTPWGEALVRRRYREALLQLAAMPHVQSVAIQTHLHVPLRWLEQHTGGKLALWCTYHPSQTTQAAFLARCERLVAMGVPHSVGVVAMREHFAAIASLRQALPPSTYLWLNAFHDMGRGYYTQDELAWLQSIDPWFDYNAQPRACAGKPCEAGEHSIAVSGEGAIRRCHFLPKVLGNIYEPRWADVRQTRACTRRQCDCYIGYSQRKDLPFEADFGAGLLARIPLARLRG